MNDKSITETPFWRNVTDADVRQAISGSFLDTICSAYAKNYTPQAPLPLILMQGILLMSVALTHKKSLIIEQPPLWGDFMPTTELAPAKASQLYINTGLGNVPNAYVLIVAPSGAGKGMGQLQLVKKLGYEEFSSCSLEGMKDAAIRNPHVLLSLQEFGSVLEGKGYKEDVKRGLTDMFNAGHFTEVLSARKSNDTRSVDWFYPSIYASVQPEVLKAAGRNLDIAQGFLSRFLIGHISPNDPPYDFNPCNRDMLPDLWDIARGLKIISRISGEVEIPDTQYNTKFAKPIRAVIDERMLPVLQRYANEYLPRIALMLAIPSTIVDLPDPYEDPEESVIPHITSEHPELPVLTMEHFERATVVMHRILAMAEASLGMLTDLEGHARLQEDNMTKMARVIYRLSCKNPAVTMAEISRNSSNSGWDAKVRIGLLNEMIQRAWIEVRDNQDRGLDKAVKGCTITLKPENLPPGIL